VLLVEDNEVNREVAVDMLHALGCKTYTAENGAAAVENFLQHRCDVVLMDCQMPVMDGYMATRELRSLATRHQRVRFPIIALTANAMDDDRARCLAADMDDFISKPFSMAELRSTLERWVGDGKSAASHGEFANGEVTLDLKAIDAIRELRAPDLLQRMIGLYDTHAPRLLEKVRIALDINDSEGAAVAAHELKSSSANLGAQRLAKLCKECELAARNNNLDIVRKLWSSSAEEYRAFRAALSELDADAIS
jgi:CheY-like chemotaxis protein/HPt (histidine-containing phosphotransfer) domain-containing protein